jgi:hypothetical protein
MASLWRLWAKALGEKASRCSAESDRVAIIRTFILLSYVLTNTFIIAGVVRHWNSDLPLPGLYLAQPLPHKIVLLCER